jgi:hypothetical protein
MAAPTDLTYNVIEGHLTGSIDGERINARASSGGRGGTKTAGAENYFLVNNPFASGVKLKDPKKGSVGGTLPMGRYTLRVHEDKKHKKNWIRLIPDTSNSMKGRAGFAIHGRGKRGSDGCIVPTDFHMVLMLYKLVEAREQAGQPDVTLSVVAIGTDVDKKMREWRQLA